MDTRIPILLLFFGYILSSIAAGNKRLLCSSDDKNIQPLNRVESTDVLVRLRSAIRSQNSQNSQNVIDALYITTNDNHQNEMVSDYNKRLKYVSGFSGSNGDVIITLNKAVLWTDSRYFLQADQELDCNWELIKTSYSKSQWLIKEFPEGANIWADAALISASDWHKLQTHLENASDHLLLIKSDKNLVDEVWINHNESLIKNNNDGYVISEIFTGESAPDKVDKVLKILTEMAIDAMVVTALDEVAWLLNIRGGDIPYSNFLEAYAVVSPTDVILYADEYKTKNISSYYSAHYPNFLNIAPYNDIFLNFKNLSAAWQKVLVPSEFSYSKGASKKVYDLVPHNKRVFKESPIVNMKAVKNDVERLEMERAHLRDSSALCQFLHYLDDTYTTEREYWNKLRIADVLYRFRSRQMNFVGLSFPTIAAFGPHGALPHYVANNFTSSPIYSNSTVVIDSGAQYYDGTTDITRTIHLGTPTDDHKEAYTRVLMGCIQLSSLTFPRGLLSNKIDVLARSALWKIGYNYGHSTGHGIGAFSNVHEAPIRISYSSYEGILLQPGNFFSIEPGIYLQDRFGVRLENIVKVIVKNGLKYEDNQTLNYLGFEDISLVPYDNKLIDFDLLDKKHVSDYYNVVYVMEKR